MLVKHYGPYVKSSFLSSTLDFSILENKLNPKLSVTTSNYKLNRRELHGENNLNGILFFPYMKIYKIIT